MTQFLQHLTADGQLYERAPIERWFSGVECIADDYFRRHDMTPYDLFSFALRFIMLCHSQEFPTLHGSINVRPEHNGPLEEALRLLGVELAAFRHWHVFADEQLSPVISKIVKALPMGESISALSFRRSLVFRGRT